MTTDQLGEYMKQVKWKTALYVAFTGAGLLLAVSGMYYGLKGDIRESTYINTVHYIESNRKMDSLHYIDRSDIQSIKQDMQTVKQDVSELKAKIK